MDRSPRSPHGTALSFAQQRARVTGYHLQECFQVVPSLRDINQEMRNSMEVLTGHLRRKDVLSSLQGVPQTVDGIKGIQTRMTGLCDRLDQCVASLVDVQLKDKSTLGRRLSLDAVGRAVSDAMSDLSGWSDQETPPPLALAPARSPATSPLFRPVGGEGHERRLTPPSSTPTPHASPFLTSDRPQQNTLSELSLVVREVQRLHDSMVEGRKEKFELDRSRIHAEERAAVEKQCVDKIRKYKLRIARCEAALRLHGVECECPVTGVCSSTAHKPTSAAHRPLPTSPQRASAPGDPAATTPLSRTDRSSPQSAHVALGVVDFMLRLLNFGDLLSWLLQTLRSALLLRIQAGTGAALPPGSAASGSPTGSAASPHSRSSKGRRRGRRGRVCLSAYHP